MKSRVRRKVLEQSYAFGACQADLDLARSICEGTYRNTKPGDPSFHAYAATLNVAGTFAAQALDLLELIPFNNQLADLQEEYMPSYPPMSPITTSYFQAWMVLDARDCANGLTIGELFAHYLKRENGMGYLRNPLDVLNASYCSFYEVAGVGDNRLKLWDIPAQKEVSCWNSSGYSGQMGEVWYVRLLPAFLTGCDHWVTLNTPYVFRRERRHSWEDFLRRQQFTAKDPLRQVQDFLKYGKSLHYWLEFVLQSYANHTGNAIFLMGLPDKAESRPHSGFGREL